LKKSLTTIIQFDNSIDANMAKTIIEENNIYCFLADENLISVNPLYSNAVGRIKLQVKNQDITSAIEILKNNNYEFKTFNKDDNLGIEPCAKCNSRKVHVQPANMYRKILAIPFLFIPLILRKRIWKCRECHYSWTEPITSNKIFFSIAIIPVLIIAWIPGYFEIKNLFKKNIIITDKQRIIKHINDISNLGISNSSGEERHYLLVDKIIKIYLKNNDYKKAISFLEHEKQSLNNKLKTNSIAYNRIEGELGILLYLPKKDNCVSLKYLKNAINGLQIIGNDKWQKYEEFILLNNISCIKN